MRLNMNLGRVGVWSNQFRGAHPNAREAVSELERLGFGTLWFPNHPEMFDNARALLDATTRIVIATGIASIWTFPPEQTAAAHATLQRAHPGRFMLGLGVSHASLVDRDQPGRYARPYTRMVAYLDALDATAEPVPVGDRMLAALGPRMLRLAAERSGGAHPYLVTPEHTRTARTALGDGSTLAPEQAVVFETDPTKARAIARAHLATYLTAPNYVNNWLRLGFDAADVAGAGSDRLVDGLVAWGGDDAVRDRIAAHLSAGADHVCVQVLTGAPTQMPLAEWGRLAQITRSLTS